MSSPRGKRYLRMFVEWVKNGDNFDPEEFLDEEGFYEENKISKNEQLIEKADDLVVKHSIDVFKKIYKILSRIICLSYLMILLYLVYKLPPFGAVSNPANNEVMKKYLRDSYKDTGATNVVTGIILDYRAFDSLGKALVLLLSSISIMILLNRKKKNKANLKPINNPILVMMAKLLIPFIILFGIYLILNGHLLLGGGFSGGIILGSALILYAVCFGFENVKKIISMKSFFIIYSSSLLMYIGIKGYYMFTGANDIFIKLFDASSHSMLFEGVLFILNISIGIIVAITVYSFYSLFQEEEI